MFHRFTKVYFEGAIKRKTRQVKTLFPLKDKSLHPSCVIYKGTCSCGETYIGETIRNASIRWEEHNDPINKSEPAKHLKNYSTILQKLFYYSTIIYMYLAG